jgi:hypothetical protein
MHRPHLPAAIREGRSELSADATGDSDDQGCLGVALHVLSPLLS